MSGAYTRLSYDSTRLLPYAAILLGGGLLDLPWLQAEPIRPLQPLIAFLVVWLFSEVVLSAAVRRIVVPASLSLCAAWLFVILGAHTNPVAALIVTGTAMLVLVRCEGWSRWISLALLWVAIALVSFATVPAMRFEFPGTAMVTRWVWDQPWLVGHSVLGSASAGVALVFVVGLVGIVALLSSALASSRQQQFVSSKRLQSRLLGSVAAALVDENDRIIECTDAFRRATTGARGTSLHSLFTRDSPDANPLDNGTIVMTHAGLPCRLSARDADGTQPARMIFLEPAEPADWAHAFLQSGAESLFVCRPGGEVCFVSNSARRLLSELEIGANAARILHSTYGVHDFLPTGSSTDTRETTAELADASIRIEARRVGPIDDAFAVTLQIDE